MHCVGRTFVGQVGGSGGGGCSKSTCHPPSAGLPPPSSSSAATGTGTGRVRLIFGSEENARLFLLALLLSVYLFMGALLFQWLEADEEDRAKLAFEESRRRFLDIARPRGRTSNDTSDGLRRPESTTDGGNDDDDINLEDLLDELLRANSEGIYNAGNRPRWDLAGSFYFVATVVSTIGYGMTTPRTMAGKMALIAYGLPGCSCAILFFNLFLERIITLLAAIMRCVHEAELRRRGFGRPPKSKTRTKSTTTSQSQSQSQSNGRLDADERRRRDRDDDDDNEDDNNDDDDDDDDDRGGGYNYGDLWKPSVHWVMFYITLLSACVACAGSFLYAHVERWTYTESLYFCFVSFATIGFGDYVPSRNRTAHGGAPAAAAGTATATVGSDAGLGSYYHLLSFVVISLGCCCVYSLFNVASIVLKAMLNSILVRLDSRPLLSCRCCGYGGRRPLHDAMSRDAAALKMRTRRNAITAAMAARSSVTSAIDMEFDSEAEDGEGEGEVELPVFEELVRLKVSLAVMQKQLYDQTAHMHNSGRRFGMAGRAGAALWPPIRSSRHWSGGRTRNTSSAFLPAAVGPLAIVTSKLQPDDT